MEIETKIKTSDLSGIRTRLEALGAKFTHTVKQSDEYYKQKGKEMETQKPGSYILRIREQPGKSKFTIKVLTETTGAWIEHETEIEKPAELRRILELAGFSKLFTINKERTYGKLDNFEICLDKVKELGNYAEFEIIAEDAAEGKRTIHELFKKLKVSEKDIEHRGYAAIISQNMGVKFEGTNG
jgi:predicted adenylyl cyclase CyaB